MRSDQSGSDDGKFLDQPLFLYDGECGFCRFWIARWKAMTRGKVHFAPAQQEIDRFPEIIKETSRRSAQFITSAGTVYQGAEAVFRMLSHAPGYAWILAFYQRMPGARPLSEAAYRFIALHRGFFSKLTRLSMGRDPEPSASVLSRWTFLRLVGLIYVIAFWSLWVQIFGLIGTHGILPAGQYLQAIKNEFGSDSYHLFPTLAWISSTDASLKLICGAGVLSGVLVTLGVLTVPALILAWICYLSLVTIGQEFLSYQWDTLLLETGFLSIFLAPWCLMEAPWRSGCSRVSSTVLWLGRWLVFRLMFLSGAVKLLSRDPVWRNLTALQYHYWTQPLPTPVAWYADQLPDWFQKASVAGVFAIELAVPFLIFTPRRFRHIGAGAIVSLQLLIALTGNYGFFNFLTIALCVLLLDDSLISRWMPALLVNRVTQEQQRKEPSSFAVLAGKIIRAVLAMLILTISISEMAQAFGKSSVLPDFARQLAIRQESFDFANSYGLFAVMTTSRVEIIVQGSNDGVTWESYEFKYKPGDLARRPRWVAPYQPRLDWQMWFAALGTYQDNPWFTNFMVRLMEGSPEVTALLQKNPFASRPPLYMRALAYDYDFTDFSTRRATGDWWEKGREEIYFPKTSLRDH